MIAPCACGALVCQRIMASRAQPHLHDVWVRQRRRDGSLHDSPRKRGRAHGSELASYQHSSRRKCAQSQPADRTPRHTCLKGTHIFSRFSAPLMLAGNIIVLTATVVPRHKPLYTCATAPCQRRGCLGLKRPHPLRLPVHTPASLRISQPLHRSHLAERALAQ